MIRMRFVSLAPALCCGIVMLTMVGCAQNNANRRDYLLDASRPGPAAAQSSDAILEVRRFSIGSEFASRGFVFRTGDFQYETDAYRQFLVAPSQMLTERTREWLASSGLFQQVLVQGSRLRPTHVLESNVIALYGDFRDPTEPVAVLEMRCFLTAEKGARQEVVFSRQYNSVTPLVDGTPEGFIKALDTCLVEVLLALEIDLIRSVSEPVP